MSDDSDEYPVHIPGTAWQQDGPGLFSQVGYRETHVDPADIAEPHEAVRMIFEGSGGVQKRAEFSVDNYEARLEALAGPGEDDA